MRGFACPVCNSFAAFENDRCADCGAALGLHLPSKSMVALGDTGVGDVAGQRWIRCTQADTLDCNWLVPEHETEAYRRGRCLADSLIRREPDASDTPAREKLVPTAAALRRLVCQLVDLGLPVEPWWQGDTAVTGLAIDRHYRFGAPADWQQSFISEYATMHPWEDFAECFAHYLHITDTIDTPPRGGHACCTPTGCGSAPGDVTPLECYDDVPVERLLSDWSWISLFSNRVNTAMGKNPLYPFTIPAPVVAKLGFVHRVIRAVAKKERNE